MIRGLRSALAWLIFPAVPVVLEDFYYGLLQLSQGLAADPYDWEWLRWLIELGPLAGFGYLAGATLGLPDAPAGGRGPRAWVSRRSVWVAVGPWMGFLAWVALYFALTGIAAVVPWSSPEWLPGSQTGAARVLSWVFEVIFVATFCYGWFVPAVAAARRARRAGVAWVSVKRGAALALAFVGSLFGSFWAVTSFWRDFFFDPRVVPAVLAAVSLALLCGCSSTVTYGEVRRRELFHAMLLAWTLGLALLWRWWARSRIEDR